MTAHANIAPLRPQMASWSGSLVLHRAVDAPFVSVGNAFPTTKMILSYAMFVGGSLDQNA